MTEHTNNDSQKNNQHNKPQEAKVMNQDKNTTSKSEDTRSTK